MDHEQQRLVPAISLGMEDEAGQKALELGEGLLAGWRNITIRFCFIRVRMRICPGKTPVKPIPPNLLISCPV